MLWLQRFALFFLFGKITNGEGGVGFTLFLTGGARSSPADASYSVYFSMYSNFPTHLANLIPLGIAHANLFLIFLLYLDYLGHCIVFLFTALQTLKKSAQINSL